LVEQIKPNTEKAWVEIPEAFMSNHKGLPETVFRLFEETLHQSETGAEISILFIV